MCLLKLSPKLWRRTSSRTVHKVEELLDTILLSTLLRLLRRHNALGALVIVVLGTSALLGVNALCRNRQYNAHLHFSIPCVGPPLYSAYVE